MADALIISTYHCSACNAHIVVPQFKLDVVMEKAEREDRRKWNEDFMNRSRWPRGVKCDRCKNPALLEASSSTVEHVDWDVLNILDISFALFEIYTKKNQETFHGQDNEFGDIRLVEELFEVGADLYSKTWKAVKEAVCSGAPEPDPETITHEITLPLFCLEVKQTAAALGAPISYSDINKGEWYAKFEKQLIDGEAIELFTDIAPDAQVLDHIAGAIPSDLMETSPKNLADKIKGKILKGFTWINAFLHGDTQDLVFYPMTEDRMKHIDARFPVICREVTDDGHGGRATAPVNQDLCHNAVRNRMDAHNVFSSSSHMLKGFPKASYFVYVPSGVFHLVGNSPKKRPATEPFPQTAILHGEDNLFLALSCHQGPRDILRYSLIITYQTLLHELEQEEKAHMLRLKTGQNAPERLAM